ncbi:MAG: radical SAM protein [Candidatus Omnitrophica bacterium]|nr:radical SAM protein [Candidatus Omnitrophota bacterium]
MRSGDAYHEMFFFRRIWNKWCSIGLDLRFYWYRLKWHLLGQYPIHTKVPTHVDIELSSACNLKCTMCPHGVPQENFHKGFIDTDIARKVIAECAQYGVSSVKFSGRGEATLHPQFDELIKYTKSLGILDVMFNTNGLLLSEERVKLIVNAGIDLVIISIDGATKETYQQIRIGGDYDAVVRNVERLIEYRKEKRSSKPLIRLQFVKMDENIHEFAAFQERWKDKVDVLVGLDYSNRTGSADKGVGQRRSLGRAYCPHPWRRLTVNSQGQALMCCVDWDAKYAIGNCRDNTIVELWNNERVGYARECIKRLEHEKIASCRECFAPISYRWGKKEIRHGQK